MIEFVKGDIFESHCFAAVNPVNCIGVMGAGLAFQFKKRYPQMFNEYKKRCDNMEMKVGRNYIWMNPKALQSHMRCTDYGEFANIICFPTKYHWKDDTPLPAALKLHDSHPQQAYSQRPAAYWRLHCPR